MTLLLCVTGGMSRLFLRALRLRRWPGSCAGGRQCVQSPGGKAEPCDADLAATLVREAWEENQVLVGVTAYLGYQEVRRPGRAPYAQVRMVLSGAEDSHGFGRVAA